MDPIERNIKEIYSGLQRQKLLEQHELRKRNIERTTRPLTKLELARLEDKQKRAEEEEYKMREELKNYV